MVHEHQLSGWIMVAGMADMVGATGSDKTGSANDGKYTALCDPKRARQLCIFKLTCVR
jgi:hypothetical protein